MHWYIYILEAYAFILPSSTHSAHLLFYLISPRRRRLSPSNKLCLALPPPPQLPLQLPGNSCAVPPGIISISMYAGFIGRGSVTEKCRSIKMETLKIQHLIPCVKLMPST